MRLRKPPTSIENSSFLRAACNRFNINELETINFNRFQYTLECGSEPVGLANAASRNMKRKMELGAGKEVWETELISGGVLKLPSTTGPSNCFRHVRKDLSMPSYCFGPSDASFSWNTPAFWKSPAFTIDKPSGSR